MDWQPAGEAWGSRFVDWAYLFEPYSRPATGEVFDRCRVTADSTLLDVGCGSGFAVRHAADREPESPASMPQMRCSTSPGRAARPRI